MGMMVYLIVGVARVHTMRAQVLENQHKATEEKSNSWTSSLVNVPYSLYDTTMGKWL